MSRSPEVEDALKFRAHSWASEALAAEVERLEAELSQANVAAKAGMYAHDERTFLAECAEKQEQRAETAEARVAELEAALKYEREYVGPSKDHTCESWRMLAQERAGAISRLEAQNARLRAALERRRGLRDESRGVAGYHLNGDIAYWGEFEDPTDAALNGGEAIHCADCDWTFPCWQTGEGCRKLNGEEAST